MQPAKRRRPKKAGRQRRAASPRCFWRTKGLLPLVLPMTERNIKRRARPRPLTLVCCICPSPKGPARPAQPLDKRDVSLHFIRAAAGAEWARKRWSVRVEWG
ncbi:hypothetical protein AcidC75_11950 [Acidisoma sp. C75]